MKKSTLSALVLASLTLSSAAVADIGPGPSPTNPSVPCSVAQTSGAAACDGKKEGDACTTTSGSGKCQTLRCATEAGTPLLACAETTAPADGGTTAPTSSSNCSVQAAGGSSSGAGLALLGLAAALTVAGARRRR